MSTIEAVAVEQATVIAPATELTEQELDKLIGITAASEKTQKVPGAVSMTARAWSASGYVD